MQVVNMTVIFSLDNRLDLSKVEEAIPDSIYNPHTFSAVKVRELQTNYSALIFNSGKVVITGVTSEEKASIAAHHLYEGLSSVFQLNFGNLEVKNMVGSFVLSHQVNLISFYNCFKGRCSYEVELFPALFYKPKDIRGTVTIFRTGRINITGVRSYTELDLIEFHIKQILINHAILN